MIFLFCSIFQMKYILCILRKNVHNENYIGLKKRLIESKFFSKTIIHHIVKNKRFFAFVNFINSQYIELNQL